MAPELNSNSLLSDRSRDDLDRGHRRGHHSFTRTNCATQRLSARGALAQPIKKLAPAFVDQRLRFCADAFSRQHAWSYGTPPDSSMLAPCLSTDSGAVSSGHRNSSASFADGFIHPSICRGRSLSMCATLSISRRDRPGRQPRLD